jgi:uncharacterized membrane protein
MMLCGGGVMSMTTTTVLFIIGGIILIILAIPMIRGKVKPNGWYGFRMPVTQKSEEIWYPANAFAGKWLAGLGVVVMITAVLVPLIFNLTADAYAIVMTVILLGGLFILFIFSYRCAKKLDAKLK